MKLPAIFLLAGALLIGAVSAKAWHGPAAILSPETCPKCLDGSKSFEKNGTIIAWDWYEDGVLIATGVKPTVALRAGVHVITLMVTDDDFETDTDEIVVTVIRRKRSRKA